MRIKEISTFTDASSSAPALKTQYQYTDDYGNSSGNVTNYPDYTRLVSQSYIVNDCSTAAGCPLIGALIMKRFGMNVTSNPVLPMYKTSGSNVAYTKVTKIELGDSKQLKTEYYYSFTPPMLIDIPENDHLREFEPRTWQSGKLKKEITYKNSNKESETIYNYNGEEIETNKGYVEDINVDLVDFNDMIWNSEQYCNNISKMYATSGSFELPLDYSAVIINKYYVNEYSSGAIWGSGVKIPYFRIYTGFDRLASKTKRQYLENGNIEEKEEYFYTGVPQRMQMTSSLVSAAKGDKIRTKFYYPQDLTSEPFMTELIAKNRVAEEIRKETFRVSTAGEIKLGEELKKYNKFYSRYQLSLPTPYTNYVSAIFAPFEIYAKKGGGSLSVFDRKLSFKRDEFYGNITEYKNENGTPTAIIWGYSHSYPIAKLENVAYTSIDPQTIANILAASQADNDNCTSPGCKEQLLRDALNNLRTVFPNALITTYTYDPLIGVTSVTDPKGEKITYSYDTFGRVKYVKDNDNNILSETNYHYRAQN